MDEDYDLGFDFLFKISVIGDAGVGKSNLISRFVSDTFSLDTKSTIGFDICNKIYDLDGFRINLQILDTAGQERFRSTSDFLFRFCAGIILVFDITSKTSFQGLDFWIEEIYKSAPDSAIIFLVSNKHDLANDQGTFVITDEEITHFQEKHPKILKIFKASAKENMGIKETFHELASTILQKEKNRVPVQKKKDNITIAHQNNSDLKHKKKCC
ncbi:hypothetical protein M0811_02771 [Anaeramoeba ignava]|uniref:Uncharacterized protein n=1 Tax=Anaeramoeba ignava TaxID=1746090 RepID=A0A9Q0L9M4_ANAIG|nr:hypothetical protein M0811_02771 [Anaeramoeba ignava]